MAVIKIDGLPEWHQFGSFAHFISKHAPQLSPLLNSAVLSAAVFTPYPWLYRFPYPHAPPTVQSHIDRYTHLLIGLRKFYLKESIFSNINNVVIELSMLTMTKHFTI